MREVSYFTKKELLKANKVAISRGYNRTLTDEINKLDASLLFPVMFSMIHEHAGGDKVDPHVRCHICLDEHGSTVYLDCDFEIFNSLGKFQSKTRSLQHESC